MTLEATGDQPITWSLADGSTLPDGLSLVDDEILGTPTVAGVYNFTIAAENDAGIDYRTFIMTIANPPAIITISLPDGTTGTSYSIGLVATGDTPISWQVVPSSGSETGLPPGLSLDTGTGEIHGAPTTAGTFTFSIRATNGVGYDTVPFSINILLAGGTFITGKEIGNLFITGKEVFRAYVGGVRIF
ncbi:MAG: Ig domain-containing protein [Defluviitaleaceae bacterium]|nr:Ig domain-containing protein [Defluviitaleaceae bacterium]